MVLALTGTRLRTSTGRCRGRTEHQITSYFFVSGCTFQGHPIHTRPGTSCGRLVRLPSHRPLARNQKPLSGAKSRVEVLSYMTHCLMKYRVSEPKKDIFYPTLSIYGRVYHSCRRHGRSFGVRQGTLNRPSPLIAESRVLLEYRHEDTRKGYLG